MQTICITDLYSLKLIERALERELGIIESGIRTARKRLEDYEKKFKFSSSNFFRKYQEGKMGDAPEIMRWAMEVQALQKLESDQKALREIELVS
jgi:hypothetical protein